MDEEPAEQDPLAARRPRVVIVGAGFGGLEAARALRKAPVEVVLVDRDNYHTFQPLLYQVATAGLEPEEIAHAVRAIYHAQENFRFRRAEVRAVEWEARRLRLGDGERLEYDFLILAAGATTHDFGVPGVAEHALALKSLADAIHLRAHVLECFEAASRDPSSIDRGGLCFVIVGGGPTGVEMAGALIELFDRVLRKDYPLLDMERARVVLIEREPRLLGAFHSSSQAYALAELARRGVEVELGAEVERVSSESVALRDGRTIASHTLIWAAGIRAAALADRLGLPQERGGRIAVEPDLSLSERPEVFVIGDMAFSHDETGSAHPQLAPVAIQGGRHAARMIQNRLGGKPSEPFVYTDRGTMATIGRHAAVAELPGGFRARGFVAWWMWLALHLVQLIGFRNRVIVLVNWAWNYFTYERGARLILDSQRHPPRKLPGEKPARDPDPELGPDQRGAGGRDRSAGAGSE
jgi:NADH dehydrogenase